MQTAPLNWSSLFSGSHRVEYKFVIDGVDYLTNDVKGIPQIRKPLMENFSIGEFASASATVEIYPKGIISRAAPVNAYCRLVSLDGNTVTEWVEQGHFFIMSRSERNGITTLTCQDAAVKAGQSYTDKTQFTEWPVPMADVVNEIASIMGVEIDPRTVIQTGSDYKVSYPNEDMLMSEVLRMIAAAHGGNWILTESGKLRLVVYGDPANAPTIEGHYQRFSPLAKTVELSRVTLTDDAGNQFTVGDDTGDELTAECFYATQAVVDALDPRIDFNDGQGVLRLLFGSFNKGIRYLNDTDDTAVVSENGRINISGSGVTSGNLKYLPYTLEGAYIDPLLELGDFLSLDFRGKTYTVYVNSIDLRCTVGYSANLALKVKDGADDEYPYTRAKDLAASRYISTSHTYHGNRINRSEGFVSEYMVNDTPVARLIANSNIFSMQQLVNGAWENRIYFDAIARKYKITGDVTVEGMLTADVLKTSGGVEISGDNITTGTISAARLDLSGVEGAIASIRSDLEGLTTTVQEVEEVAIASVVVQYALGTSSSTAPDSGWSATAPAWESGKYMWQRTVTTYADSTEEKPHVSISDPTCIQGAKGQDGAPGTNAYNTALVYLYKRSATAPTVDWTNALTYNFANKALTSIPSGWSSTFPAGTNPLYVTVATAYGQGATDSIPYTEWTAPVLLVENGEDGQPGTNGNDGVGISTVTVSYAVTDLSPASVDPTTLTWGSALPSVPEGSYLWIRTITDYTNGTDSITYTYSRQGEDGETGEAGTSVSVSSIQYQAGDSATTPPTGTWSNTPVTVDQGKYLWTKTTFSDGNVAYGVARQGINGINGTNGKDGTNGTNGKDGKDGTSSYVHIKYSPVADPSDAQMTDIPSEYIGLCVDNTPADPTASLAYTWSKWEGDDGADGLPGTNGKDGTSEYVHFAYSTSSDGTSNFSIHSFDGAKYLGVCHNDTQPDPITPASYEWSLIKGADGYNGTDGLNVATVYLYQRSATVPAKPTMPLIYSFESGIIYTGFIDRGDFYVLSGSVDKGELKVDDTTLPGAVITNGVLSFEGLSEWKTYIPDSDGNPCYVIQATAANTEKTDSILPTEWSDPTILLIDGKDGRDGKDGTNGTNGNGINSVTIAYGVSDSSSVQPTNWQNTIPSVPDGQYLWIRTTTDYTDSSVPDTVTYSYAKQGEDGEQGVAGTSVSITSIQYQQGDSATTPPTGTWSNSPVSVAQGKYLWTKTTFSDGSTAYGVARQGVNGDKGDDGAGIKSVTVSYGVSASASVQPTNWQTALPTVADGQYLWTRTTIDYTDSSIPDTTTYTYAKQGEDGEEGQAGTSVAVSSIQYQAGTSATTPPTGTWSDNPVTVVQGQYLWTKTTFSDGSTAYGVARQGVDGANGDNGVGISSVTVTYGVSNSASVQPSSWQNSLPVVADGQYLWTKTITDYTDSSIPDTVTYTYAKQGEDGENGQAGTSVTVSSIQYQAGTSATTPPTGTWSNDVVAVNPGQYLWTKTTFSDGSTAYGVARQGVNGTTGYNTAIVYLYKRSASAPSVDWTNALTYNFTNKALTSVPDGWSATVPSGTSPLYVTTATAYSNTETDSIAASEWSSPVVLAQNGSSGTNGLNAATVFLYQRKNGEAPAKPSSALTYTFSTGRLSGTLGDWSQTVPASNGSPCYVTQATASSRSSSVSIAASAWSAPVIFVEDGADGAKGDDGVGIESIVTEYYLANSSYIPTGEETTGWVTTPPAWESGKKIWTRSHITWDNGTESYTDPECNNTVTSFGQKYTELKQTVDELNLSVVDSEDVEVGTLTSSGTSGVYAFEKTNDGFYSSTNQGIANSVSWGKLSFDFEEDTRITITCINYGENLYDYGVVSAVDVELDTNYQTTYPTKTSSLSHTFYNECSPNEVSYALLIPAGEHFITFKYRKDGRTDANSDTFKIKTHIPPRSSVLSLKSGTTVLSSAIITFDGLVRFTDLSTGGMTVISGDNIITGSIDASKVTVKNLSASNITAGTLSASRISGGTLDASLINVTNLSASSITTGTFSANRISGGTLDASSITVTNLDASSITSGKISADRIDVDNLHISKVYYGSSSNSALILTAYSGSGQTGVEIGAQNSAANMNWYYAQMHLFRQYNIDYPSVAINFDSNLMFLDGVDLVVRSKIYVGDHSHGYLYYDFGGTNKLRFYNARSGQDTVLG